MTLQWTPPSSGPAPTGYVLEGGVNPGEVLASIATGSTAPIVTIVAPTGSFYVRMLTQTASGRSPASNEIRIHVNVPVPPSAPTNLLGLVNGNTIALAWKNTFAGGSPANLVLDVTGSLATSIPLGATGRLPVRRRAQWHLHAQRPCHQRRRHEPAVEQRDVDVPGGVFGRSSNADEFPHHQGRQHDLRLVGRTREWLRAHRLRARGHRMRSTARFPTPGRALSGTVGPGTYNISVYAANSCGNGPATAVQSVTIP